MRVAVVYNHAVGKVLNRLGAQNREKYPLETISDIVAALESRGHQVAAFEGDMDLVAGLSAYNQVEPIDRDDSPVMVLNLAYGVQGSARYTHVPALLEMMGLPYVGSGPLAHGLALDKVVTKTLLLQHGLPTPEFRVLGYPDYSEPGLSYPLVVKPRDEAASFGLSLVHNHSELEAAVAKIFRLFESDALVEKYIPGREVNVGILGSSPPAALPPVEICFGSTGPDMFFYEDKMGLSSRDVRSVCPADLPEALALRAQDLAVKVFRAVGCLDFARVDMRIDNHGSLHVLEINSLPSLRRGASYVRAAECAGIDYPHLLDSLLDSAFLRYFDAPEGDGEEVA